MVIPNIWAMCHDEEHYLNPSQFNPDRLFYKGTINTNPNALSEDHYTFGFGRRFSPFLSD